MCEAQYIAQFLIINGIYGEPVHIYMYLCVCVCMFEMFTTHYRLFALISGWNIRLSRLYVHWGAPTTTVLTTALRSLPGSRFLRGRFGVLAIAPYYALWQTKGTSQLDRWVFRMRTVTQWYIYYNCAS